jgi:CRISPR-associated protein Csb3
VAVAEAWVPVDLFNPGQVFACIGLVEAANELLGDAEAVFDWSDPLRTRFRLRACGEMSLQFLEEASAFAVAPKGSASIDSWIDAWGSRPIAIDRALGYPFPDPKTPATMVCVLRAGDQILTIDYWGDETQRDSVKLWAGMGGYPGVALARDALAQLAGRSVAAASDPFSLAMPQSSSFRLDWRPDYIPLDAGFSLNKHGNIHSRGFPLVEMLGAIGLTHARPQRPNRRDKLEYRYGIAGRAAAGDDNWLPPPILRAALGGTSLPFPMRCFRMSLDWPGKENQARSITTVTEETTT